MPACSLAGNRIISLILLGQFIEIITKHSVLCSSLNFLGESHCYGLASIVVCQCLKCSTLFRFTSSEVTSYNTTNHYTVNTGATLGQIATGGGADHLKEQLACMQVPSLSSPTFISLERTMEAVFEAIVSNQLLSTAGQVERRLAIAQGNYHNAVPAITVVVDGGWSNRSHKHSYNANSGVGVIFGAATKALLFNGVRNKYCSVCAINTRNEKPIPTHHCYHNWSMQHRGKHHS